MWLGAGIPVAWSAERPYDESLDANAAMAHTLREAAEQHQHVLVIFGANWCDDCRALDAALHQPAMVAALKGRFKVVKVDVGNFNRNLDLTARYGDPIRNGIPAAVMLSADGRVRYATKAGELANARRMGPDGIARFFEGVLSRLD